jgi:hypothetical protein
LCGDIISQRSIMDLQAPVRLQSTRAPV